jgi:hypothetical protein
MKTLRVILVLTAISLASMLHAQKRVAVFIVGDYTGYGIPQNEQWNDGNMGGGTEYGEFWNDTYLNWEYLCDEPNKPNLGYYNDFIFVLFANGQDYQPPGYANRYKLDLGEFLVDEEASSQNVTTLLTGLVTGNGSIGGDAIPQLTDDDFLYIWTMGHGGTDVNGSYMHLKDDVMYDSEFAGMVNNITAQKKVITMQQGYGGGFADNFTGNNVIFYAACQSNQNGHRANNTPYLENELWNNVPYYHGEFNFHTYSPLAGESPGFDDEYNGTAYATVDADNNNVITINEMYAWENTHSNTSETSLFADPGGIASTTTLKYPNVISDNITSTTTMSGFIGVTKPVHIVSGATLTITNARLYLDYEGDIIVDNGATLIIDDGVEITGWCQGYQNKIIVNGNMDVGSEVIFLGENDVIDDYRLKITSVH